MGQTGISTTLRSALNLPPKSLTPPDGAPGPTDTSKTLFLPRDLTRRDGGVVQMDISTTLLRSRSMWIGHKCFFFAVLEPKSYFHSFYDEFLDEYKA